MQLGAKQVSSNSGRGVDLLYATVALVLTTCELVVLKAAMRHVSLDITGFYYLWYEHILHFGRWASLEGGYANYSPPYLYILSAFSLLDGKLSAITLIKLAQVPGMLAAAYLFWSLCRFFGCSQRRSLLAAWIVLVAPEVFQNTLVWGQCDMLHTAWLLAMLRLFLAKRPGWAMAAFGVAIAFKLQAIFAGAVVAALIFSAEIPLWTVLCTAGGYIVMMVPAWLAGRPWKQLLFIYHQQYGAQPDIAKDVANPYQLIDHFSGAHARIYVLALYGGFLCATAATAWLTVFLMSLPWRLRGQRLVLAFAVALLMEPYVLPKMHDRYFFAGDVLGMLLAMLHPRLWVPATLLQISALIVAYPHLYAGTEERTPFFVLPVLITTVALVWLFGVFRSAYGLSDAIQSPG